jgi:two-component system, OmpR family, response regulator BaeR
MPGQNILIVEDDRKTAELLSDYLALSDFNVSLLDHGDHVDHEVRLYSPDLIILDIMLPCKDGISICQELRSLSKIPILILSAKMDDLDRIPGLESGVVDYICKPFSPEEVVARIKAILRRKSFIESIEGKFAAEPITINPERYNTTIAGKDLHLTLIEFQLLKLMASMPVLVAAGVSSTSALTLGKSVDKYFTNI